jgi:hypothetical protein
MGKNGKVVKTCNQCRAKDAKQAKKPEVRARKNEFQRGKDYHNVHRAKKRAEDEDAFLARNAEVQRAYRDAHKNHLNAQRRLSRLKNQPADQKKKTTQE